MLIALIIIVCLCVRTTCITCAFTISCCCSYIPSIVMCLSG